MKSQLLKKRLAQRPESRLRLAIVTPGVKRGEGQGRVNYEIAKRALARGYHVTLIANIVAGDLRPDQSLRVASMPSILASIGSTTIRSELGSLFSENWLRRHRREFDIVHVNGSFTVAPSDVNSIHFVHAAYLKASSVEMTGFETARMRWFASRDRIAYGRARSVVAVSNRVRTELEALGVPSGKISVIHNGVDIDEFHPGKRSRRDLQIPEDQFVFLFAGDLTTHRKNLDGVLRALARVTNAHLAVVGETRGSPYPGLALELGIAGRVHFLGYRRDIADIMRSVDAFVFPSRYEACSLVLLEALASGLPVITAITAGGAEIVGEAGGIVLDHPDRNDLLIEAMSKIATDEKLRVELGQRARITASRFTWTEMADKYLSLYEQTHSRHES